MSVHSPNDVDDEGPVSVRTERDFMRSATAMVAGVVGVAGDTDSERGFVDVR